MTHVRMKAEDRKAALVAGGVEVAARVGFTRMTKPLLCSHMNCSTALLNFYWGTLPKFKAAVLKRAIRDGNLRVIGHAVAAGEPGAVKLAPELRQQALASLG